MFGFSGELTHGTNLQFCVSFLELSEFDELLENARLLLEFVRGFKDERAQLGFVRNVGDLFQVQLLSVRAEVSIQDLPDCAFVRPEDGSKRSLAFKSFDECSLTDFLAPEESRLLL